jgi:SlyX protein
MQEADMPDSLEDCLENRLVALESRLAHHERMAEELSDCVLRQGRSIDLLTRQVSALRDRVRELENRWAPSPQDERPPPHY